MNNGDCVCYKFKKTKKQKNNLLDTIKFEKKYKKLSQIIKKFVSGLNLYLSDCLKLKKLSIEDKK